MDDSHVSSAESGGLANSRDQEFHLPPHGLRVAAAAVDLVVVGVVFGVLLLAGQVSLAFAGVDLLNVATGALALIVCVWTVMASAVWLTDGQTLGKALFGLTERRVAGRRPLAGTTRDLGWAFARHTWGYVVVDVLGLGVATALVTPRRRSLHDIAFGDEVVHDGSRWTRKDVLARADAFHRQLEAGQERSRRRYGALYALWGWTTKLVALVAGVVFVVAKLAAPSSALGSSSARTASTSAELPEAAPLASKAAAGLFAATAVATGTVVYVALPGEDYTNLNVVTNREIVGRPETSEVYLMKADGDQLKQLTDNDAPDWGPDLFRDRLVVFYSERDGDLEVYRMDVDGSHQVRLTNSPGRDACPHWSPDGRRIVFDSERDGDLEIYVIDADGSSPTRLTDSQGADYCPELDSDGRRIVFSSLRDGNSELYVMDANGANPRRLTDEVAPDYDATWAPDDRAIAFTSERDGEPNVYMVRPDGTGVERLTNDDVGNHAPFWAPDGKRLFFWSGRGQSRGGEELWSMRPDGSDQQQISHLNE